MGFFKKLFGGESKTPAPVEETEVAEAPPVAVIVLRRGMSVPNDEYIEKVLRAALPALDAGVHRIGLSQPSWYKNEELADSMASDVAVTFAKKFSVESHTHRRRVVEGPEGAQVMIVELHRA